MSHVLTGLTVQNKRAGITPSTTRAAIGVRDSTPRSQAFVQPPARIYIQSGNIHGERRWQAFREMKWSRIEWPKSADYLANIEVTLDARGVRSTTGAFSKSLKAFEEKVTHDRRIMILQQTETSSPPLFIGYAISSQMRWDGDSQSVAFQLLSEPQERLRTGICYFVRGRMMANTPADEVERAIKQVESLPAVFNQGGEPNRSKGHELITIAGITHKVHTWTTDNEPGAELWTTVQALRALAYWWIARQPEPAVDVTDFLRDTEVLAESPPVTGDAPSNPFDRAMLLPVDNVAVHGMNIDQAIIAVADSAGAWTNYEFNVSAKEILQDSVRGTFARLRVGAAPQEPSEANFDPTPLMGSPVGHDIARQEPFKDWAGINDFKRATQSKHIQASITKDRNSINAPLIVGGLAEYEVSLLLRPGWTPHADLDGITSAEDLETAFDTWLDQFVNPEFTTGRIPTSIYHAEHPDQSLDRADEFTPEGGVAAVATGKVSDVFRLWIFPDDAMVVDKAALARSSPHDFYSEEWYDPWVRQDDPADGTGSKGLLDPARLMYNHEVMGGGLPLGVLRDWGARRRPFGNTIGRFDNQSTNTGPIVRIHFGESDGSDGFITNRPPPADDAGWTRFSGAVEILEDRAGIRFLDGNILTGQPFVEDTTQPLGDHQGLGLAMMNYIAGHFWVQVTCTVVSDSRISVGVGYNNGSIVRERSAYIDTGYDRYRKRIRRREFSSEAGNSILQWFPTPQNTSPAKLPSAFDESAYEDRDDTEKLVALTQREENELVFDTIAGSIDAFFLDRSIRPGDYLTGVSGLGITYDRWPEVERVTWTNGPGGMRTSYSITDTREQPDAGAPL